MSGGRAAICFILICLPVAAQAFENLRIGGIGWGTDRQLRATIAFLHGLDPSQSVDLEAVFIEDTAFLLLDQLKELGFLFPAIHAEFNVGDTVRTFTWKADYQIQLPSEFHAQSGRMRIEAGVLFFYDSVQIEGVHSMDTATLQRFFIPGGALFQSKRDRAYTARNFQRRLSRLMRTLDAQGYRDARVLQQTVDWNEETGAVSVHLVMDKGAMHRVGSVKLHSGFSDDDLAKQSAAILAAIETGHPFTNEWLQDVRQQLLNLAFRRGYANATAQVRSVHQAPLPNGDIEHQVVVDLQPGRALTLAGVRFDGTDALARRTLLRQTGLVVNDPLDILAVDEARRRLMGLRVFQAVHFELEPIDTDNATVVFDLEPRPARTLELLAGWGSYEQARTGLRWTNRNLWRRAHLLGFEGKVSMRAYHARTTYSIPQIFGTLASAHVRAEYSFREERTFDASQSLFSIGSSYVFPRTGIVTHLEYQIERVEVDRDPDSDFIALNDATIASLTLRAMLDRRDNPLYPSRGWSSSAVLKTAVNALGGSVDFQKLELSASLHRPITQALLVHGALRFGSLYTWSDDLSNLPFAERFFPGGENSVRSYPEGAAGPLDSEGRPIGARTILQANLELEQRLLQSVSLILFYDSLWYSVQRPFELSDGPLQSVGIGLRYRTVVGPIRFEYGRTLNPRPFDPSGTFHFSIGFPF